ncbi:hypothetical protein DPEC_G00085800 [Dallia pectoralis]|uniref:Uncharacterized protein n=1 Tax=Dallia pectoralis TaxID=75939 RepID=A0ACC2H0B8_DALPE|nr:hypothetical protein DPEC_G00085800 [Dallia pectoralis]
MEKGTGRRLCIMSEWEWNRVEWRYLGRLVGIKNEMGSISAAALPENLLELFYRACIYFLFNDGLKSDGDMHVCLRIWLGFYLNLQLIHFISLWGNVRYHVEVNMKEGHWDFHTDYYKEPAMPFSQFCK